MPAEISKVCLKGQALTGLVQAGLGDLGDIDRELARSNLAGCDHPGSVEVFDRVGRQLDGGVERVPIIGEQRAELEVMPSSSCSVFGWYPAPRRCRAWSPPV